MQAIDRIVEKDELRFFQPHSKRCTASPDSRIPPGTPRQIQMRLREMLLSLTTQPAGQSEVAAEETPSLPGVEQLKMEVPQPQATDAPVLHEEK
ncbi:MAG TPA: hypothetical protein VFE47_09190 [Tepidisphaeraceae bacterium]|nr:hypothetical protein [Tepidisphaeraceae bacterium]